MYSISRNTLCQTTSRGFSSSQGDRLAPAADSSSAFPYGTDHLGDDTSEPIQTGLLSERASVQPAALQAGKGLRRSGAPYVNKGSQGPPDGRSTFETKK